MPFDFFAGRKKAVIAMAHIGALPAHRCTTRPTGWTG